ncbi:MAG TPA: GNAT family N-acetyltransferase [Anaerolineae bacterium]|nr:GNAT family N-acetyltransferase [Anaerolineae bacterium]HQI85437.1 GNAT family N-acetyltransferase [Anaerolineae bacterium]
MDTGAPLDIKIIRGELLSEIDRHGIVALCSRAYEQDMEPLFATFANATHVLGFYNGILVSHALWVTRYLQVGAGLLLRTAYVEAVATDEAYRQRGFATAIMQHLAGAIQDFDLAALSPFSVAYYARLGWELWRGPLFVRTEDGLLPSPDDEEVMILRLPKTPILDVSQPLSAEWREGELW